jgi:hypothetical protein
MSRPGVVFRSIPLWQIRIGRRRLKAFMAKTPQKHAINYNENTQ